MAQVTETVHTDWNVCWKELGSIHGQAGRFRVRIPGAHVLRLISQAGKRVRRCPL